MKLIKPRRLTSGDTVATVSCSHGWAGEPNTVWKYNLGKKRLEEIFNLHVIAAPNSMKGFEYLRNNPKARAEDIMWAFENKNVSAVITNVGGNDSIRLIPFIDDEIIKRNPKIFIGYSDVMNIHLLCYKNGLSSFYGPNFLSTISEAQAFHKYSEKWFRKVLFDTAAIGEIEPSKDWAYEPANHNDKDFKRNYYPNAKYELIQGQGAVRGSLLGGHTGISELEGEKIELCAEDFEETILFIEGIPEFFSPDGAVKFFRWLGNKGFLQNIKGIIIGKLCENISFAEHGSKIKSVVSDEFKLINLPILYGLNFGHSSPMFIIPYGAQAEINCEKKSFSIVDAGVI